MLWLQHDLGSKHESKFEAPLVKFKIYADTNSIPSGEGSDCIQTALEVQVTSVSISMSTMVRLYHDILHVYFEVL